MILRPASFLGLVLHDLRLSSRGALAFLGDRSARSKAVIGLSALVALHAAAWPLGLWIGGRESGPDGAEFLTAGLRAGVLLVLPWAIASPLSGVTRMLYQRGDLDLLFASPLNPRVALGARALSQGLEGVSAVGLLLAPLANVGALQGHPHWLALYPALAGAGLFGAGLGLALALLLFFALGPRRARAASQLAATLIGASAVLAAQLIAMLPTGPRGALYSAFSADAHSGLGQALTIPERAAGGEMRALLAWLVLGASVFAVAVTALGGRFALAAMRSAGAPAIGGRTGEARFREGLAAALRVKEHRLLWRDPWLLSQMALQTLYTLPIAVILWRNGGAIGGAGMAFAPTLVVIAGQLAGSLAWIALSGEDAPDFLATAPATRGRVERAKLVAVATPVAMVLALPLAALAFAAPRAALVALVCGTAASASGALLMLWRQAPARRGLVLRRHSQSKLIALFEHWLSLGWALTTGMAVLGTWLCLAPAALIAITLWLVKPRERRAAARTA